jgi:class 3 adenylate cyclase
LTVALARGDLERAEEFAAQTLGIGRRFADADLEALGLHDQGRVLVKQGRVDDGLALLDEATLAAMGGELGAYASAIVYCNVIETCRDLADYRRARDWTETATRWCDRQAIAGFPGICRVRRAEMMRLRGSWAEAEQEVRRACEELLDFAPAMAAYGFYELGEIRLRVGDLLGAEAAFRQAHELGREPQPGLALLRLAQGNVDTAMTSVKGALAAEGSDSLGRAALLPAALEIALAAGDVETASAAATELEDIARAFGTPVFEATAIGARGKLQLAQAETELAIQSLRRGVGLWRDLETPYEAARARMCLAAAYQAHGDDESAALELAAARSAFEALGAVPDGCKAVELLEAQGGGEGARVAAHAGQTVTRVLMFTDIVDSTSLTEAIGDDAWGDLLVWHDQTLRSAFARNQGQEIDHAGDGFFVAFQNAAAATACAVEIQRKLRDHRREHGFAPQIRIGLHGTEATRKGMGYRGKGVHTAARIAASAKAAEIVASAETLAGGAGQFRTSGPRRVKLKGVSEPAELLTVEWR